MGNRNLHFVRLVAIYLSFGLMLQVGGTMLALGAVENSSMGMGIVAVPAAGWFHIDAGGHVGIYPVQMCMADQWPRPERLLWGTLWSSGGLALSEDNGALYESAGRLVWSGRRLVLRDSEPLDMAGRLVWSG